MDIEDIWDNARKKNKCYGSFEDILPISKSMLSCIIILEVKNPHHKKDFKLPFRNYTWHYITYAGKNVMQYFFNPDNNIPESLRDSFEPDIKGRLANITNYLRPYFRETSGWFLMQGIFQQQLTLLEYIDSAPSEIVAYR